MTKYLTCKGGLLLAFMLFFYAFSGFASASYFVAGSNQQQTTQTQSWTEYAATPENTTATNITLTAINSTSTAGALTSSGCNENTRLNSTQALAVKLVSQTNQFSNFAFGGGKVSNGRIDVASTEPSTGYVQWELVLDNGNSPTGAVIARGWNTTTLVNSPSTINLLNASNFSVNAGTYWVRANVSAGSVCLSRSSSNATRAVCDSTFGACTIYNSSAAFTVPAISLVQPLFTTSPLISSSNDSRTLDFAVARDNTFRVLLGAQYQEAAANARYFPVLTIDAVINRTDPSTSTYWGLQDNGGGWVAGFGGTATGNNLFCIGEGGVSSALFAAPALTTRHNYTVKVFPASVECWIDGTLYATVAHTNGNVAWRHYANSPDAATNVTIYGYRNENALPSNAQINVLANGSGNYSYSGTNASDIWLNASGILTWLPFIAPLGSNHSYFTATFNAAANANFSTDAITWNAYTSGTLTANNTRQLFLRFNQTPSSFVFASNLSNTSATSLPKLVPGNNTLSITQSDNSSNQANLTFSRNETSGTVQYSPQLLESQAFTANQINLVPNTTSTYVSNIYYSKLYYDGTEYLVAICTPLNCTRSLQANASQANTSHSFYWFVNVSFPGGNWTFTRQNESYNQYIYQINATNCSLGGSPTLNFTTIEEENSSSTLATQNANFDLRSADGTVNRSVQYNASSTQNLTICLPPSATQLYADSFQNYFANGYNTRYYFLRNASLNATMQTIPLYLENSAQAQQTEITLTDQNSQPLAGYYIRISRYFPSENAYRLIAMVLTAENGKASVPLRTNDQFYQFTILNSTSVVTTFSQQNIPCNPASTLCTITIKVPIGQTTLALYQTLGSATTLCTTTNTSVSCTVADTSGLVRNWTLNLIRSSITGYTTVCSNTITTTSGSLYCNTTPAYAARDHHYTLQADYNPSIQVNAGTLQKAVGTTWGTDGLIASFFLIIALIGIGIWNPAASVIMGLLGFIISFWLGWMPVPIGALVGIAVVLLVFAYKMKT